MSRRGRQGGVVISAARGVSNLVRTTYDLVRLVIKLRAEYGEDPDLWKARSSGDGTGRTDPGL